MAILTKDELLTKIESTGLSDDEKISFMEDISDSFNPTTTKEYGDLLSERDKYKSDYEDMMNKYKERFLSNDSKVEKMEIKKEPEMEEKKIEYVDIKDIFTKKGM